MNIKEELQGTDKLSFFQELYHNAKANRDEAFLKLEQHYDQYKGSPKMDGENARDASVVRNITYELIESQITGYIPSVKVDTRMVNDKFLRNTEAIERLVEVTLDRVGIEEMNDIDERYTYIYGGSIWLVEWDESETTHNTIGDVKLTNISPRRFTPQPKIFNVQDMEYCFVEFDTTKEEIVRKYDVPFAVAEDAANEDGDDEDTATLYVCFYKNDDGKVCEYVWAGDTELLDIDDFYARKRKICTKCGKREGLCTCDKPKYKLQSEDFEELDHDIVVNGEVYIPMESDVIRDGEVMYDVYESQAVSEMGVPQFNADENGNLIPLMQVTKVPKKEPTKLPFYRPNLLPIVIRKNTSQEDSLLGQSDCEFIRPQQQAINKIESRIMDKLLKAGVVPTVPDDYMGTITDGVFDRAIRLKPGQENLFGRMDLQVSINGDIAESERLYDHAKRILGISDSFQGQHDASAASGVAKQIQVNQSSGRLESKRRMKNHAYACLYEIIFQLYLAYADEPRPITYKDAIGKVHNTEFNRYAFIERDEAGEYYYNDQYLFAADNASDVEQYRQYLWEKNLSHYSSGAFGDPASPETRLTYWRQMERAHYPFAHAMVEEIEEQMRSQIAQMSAANAEMSAEIDARKGYEEYLKGEIANGTQNIVRT